MQKQKGVSTLILIITIIAVALVAVGGVFTYQYFATKTQPVVQTQQNQNQNTNQTTQPSITVTSPNGGETLTTGQTYNITWPTQSCSSRGVFDIYIYDFRAPVPGYYGQMIGSAVSCSSGSYSWIVPNNITPGNNVFKIQFNTTAGEQRLIDESNNYFSIVAPTNQTAGLPVQSQQATEGWKTYTNTQYGFQMNYPAGYNASNTVANEPYYVYQLSRIFSADLANKGQYLDGASFEVLAGNSSYDIENCLKNPNFTDGRNITTTKNINGDTFYVSYEGGDAAMGGQRGFVSYNHILHNNVCFVLQYKVYYHQIGWPDNTVSQQEVQAQNDAVNSQKDLMEQILSTFKFTK